MIKLFLVRHGEATQGWTSKDPPLSDLGKSQALSLAPFIDKIDLNKVDLVSSPLTRCKETANLALSKYKQEVEINDIFRELPSPIADLEKRVIWLRRVLPLTWPELLSDEETIASGVDLNEWREKIIDKIYSLKNDTIIFTHFVVINNIIGHIMSSEKIVNFQPANCSVTEIKLLKNQLQLIKLGKSLETKVN